MTLDRGVRRVGVGLLAMTGAIGVVLATTSRASAEAAPLRARLEVVREPGTAACASQLDLERAVAERLGRDPFDEHALAVVRVTIAIRGSEHVAALHRFDEEGKEVGAREISSAGQGCGELSSAIALALAIAMDPEHDDKAPPPVVAPPRPPQVRAAPPPSLPPPPALVPPPPEPLHAMLGADVHAALGSAPAAAAGFSVHVELRLSRFELDLEGRGDLPAGTALPPSGEVRSSLLLGRLAPCIHFAFAYGCALGSIGALNGSAAIGGGRDQTTAFGGLGARIGLEIPLFSPLVLRPHAEVEATLVRTSLDYGGVPAWKTPPAYGALALELAVRVR